MLFGNNIEQGNVCCDASASLYCCFRGVVVNPQEGFLKGEKFVVQLLPLYFYGCNHCGCRFTTKEAELVNSTTIQFAIQEYEYEKSQQ